MTDMYGPAVMPWRQKAATLATEILAIHAADVDSNARFPTESMTALSRAGLYGLCVDSSFGGQGQGPDSFAAVVEEWACQCASTAMVYVMHVTATRIIAASTILPHKADVLRAISAGQHLNTIAFSEQGSRSQFWVPVSQLTEQAQGYRTDATKSWVTAAQRADSYVTSAQRPAATSPLEFTLYLLPRTRAGVQCTGAFNGLGLRGNDSAPVQLSGVAVAPEDLLTEHGNGLECALQVGVPWFNIGTAAMAHGLCLAAVQATAQHLQGTGFAHTGTGLRDLPNLRARLAEMSVATEQSRALWPVAASRACARPGRAGTAL